MIHITISNILNKQILAMKREHKDDPVIAELLEARIKSIRAIKAISSEYKMIESNKAKARLVCDIRAILNKEEDEKAMEAKKREMYIMDELEKSVPKFDIYQDEQRYKPHTR